MILLDVNLLIYAVNEDTALHRKAKGWLEHVLGGNETVGLSWNVLLAFIRITTRAGLFSKPLALETAFDLVDGWLEQSPVIMVHPGPRHARILRELLAPTGTGGNLTSDAHLAALALENDADLCSSDADFARFPRLRWKNPLAESTPQLV